VHKGSHAPVATCPIQSSVASAVGPEVRHNVQPAQAPGVSRNAGSAGHVARTRGCPLDPPDSAYRSHSVRYHVPRSVLGSRCEEQTGPVDKLGGLPWGFPVTSWPVCRECGRPQSHVAQLQHDGERLDLGGEGRVLVLFQCDWGPDPCQTFRPEYGANAAMIIDTDADGLTLPPEPCPQEVPELRVAEWMARDDGIAPDRYSDFFDDDQFSTLYHEGLLDTVPLETKIAPRSVV
jgi:hypothetical protein